MFQSLPAASSSQPTQDTVGLPYFAGLDGLRAIAVIAVLLYHAGLPVRGGFLGVEAFFVLSGFLITALLAAEWQRSGRINLGAFWLRRARRLLPALGFVLFGTLLIGALLLRGERVALDADTLAALGFVMNWRLIAGGQSYFDPLVRPSLLQHLWSLAVEEQFYLVWPLLFVGGMRLFRRKGMLLLTLATALGSMALMAQLYRPGADPSRIYYGTDTRAGGILVGAALALVWTTQRSAVVWGRGRAWLPDATGAAALAGLIASFVWLPAWHPLLYRGGFALIDLATVLLIVVVTSHSATITQRLLGWRPLRWIGVRSYGLYLWHWPIFMVTRPFTDVALNGWPLLGLRLVIIGLLVEASYRLIELPIRRGAGVWPWRWAQSHAPEAAKRWPRNARLMVGWLCLLAPLLGLFAARGAALAPGQPQRVASTSSGTSGSEVLSVDTLISPVARSLEPTSTPTLIATPPGPAPAAAAGTALPDAPTTLAETSTAQATPAAAPTPANPQPLDPALIARLQALLDQTVADRAIPGAVLSVGIPGYLPWNGASGLANRATGQPMEPDALIHISSITKMFTAVLVLQLAAAGALDLDAPIDVYLPDIVPLANRTSARHLLGHTSGVFDYLEDSQFFIEAYQNPERSYTPAELVDMIDQYGAAFEPGTPGAWKYSSTNYVILGMLVEQVTGKPLAQEMRQRIFEPLGLQQTFFAPQEAVAGTVTEGYIGASDRADVSMTFVFATGNIISSAGDLRRFAEGLWSGELLSAESLAQMTAVTDTGGAYDMPELQYGLGVMQAQLSVGLGPNGEQRPDNLSTVLGHIGGIAGSRAAMWRVPDSGITLALGLNQADVDPNVLARDALEIILTWQGQ